MNTQIIKLVLIGEMNTGKTTLFNKYSKNAYTETYIPTVSADYYSQDVEINGIVYTVQLWDIPGDAAFKTFTSFYLRNAHGVILLFDVNNRGTFNEVQKWINKVRAYTYQAQILVVGNKNDCLYDCGIVGDRDIEMSGIQVYKQDIVQMIEEYDVKYMDISLKYSDDVDKVIIRLAKLVIKFNIGLMIRMPNVVVLGETDETDEITDDCC